VGPSSSFTLTVGCNLRCDIIVDMESWYDNLVPHIPHGTRLSSIFLVCPGGALAGLRHC
jgi:hypothetical protein